MSAGPAAPTDLSAQRVHGVPVAVLDLELTGLSPEVDRICEVAVVQGARGQILREFQTLIRPSAPMSEGALACHGITDAMLRGAPAIGEVSGGVLHALAGSVIVCHHAEVDLGFLQRELPSGAVEAPVVLDTLLIARRLFAFPSNGLSALCASLSIPLEGAHRALADARATFALFHRLIDALDPQQEMTVSQVDALVSSMAPDSPTREGHLRLLREALREGVRIEIAYQSSSDPLHGLTVRKLDPWSLQTPRLRAFCHLRQAERVFRIERIRSVRLLAERSVGRGGSRVEA